MPRGQRLRRKSRRRRSQDEEQVAPRPVGRATPRVHMAQLQRQVGNRAVAGMLAQRKGAEEQPGKAPENVEKAPVAVGQIKIERPKIEYYDVDGASLREVARQLLRSDEWYEYEYKYAIKAKKGVVTRMDVTVMPTVRLPRWRGPGWEKAPDREKVEWLRMLDALGIDPNTKLEDESAVPAMWLDPNWEDVPDTTKGEWRAMLQVMQREERGYVDVIRRHALVLQQRTIGQPAGQVKAIFDQFTKDLKVEREKYDRQVKFGKKTKVSLEASAMVQ